MIIILEMFSGEYRNSDTVPVFLFAESFLVLLIFIVIELFWLIHLWNKAKEAQLTLIAFIRMCDFTNF